MAEVARLGLEIDAKGVSETRAELLRLAQSAAEAARNFEGVGDSVARSGEKIAGAPDGFASFEVSAKKADPTIKQFAKSAASGTVALLELGPAGNAAANALQAVLMGAGPAALAMAAIGAAIAFVNFQVDKQREKFRELAERELAGMAKATKDLEIHQTLAREMRLLKSLDPEIDNIREKYEALKLTLKNSTPENRAKAAENELLELEKLANKRADARAKEASDEQAAILKERQAIDVEIAARQLQNAAIGRTGESVNALTLAQRLNALATSEQATKHAAQTQAMIAAEKQAFALKTAYDRIAAGKQDIAGFQNQFGVTFDIEKQIAADKLASQFGRSFEVFKNDPAKARQIGESFRSLVEQAIELRVPNIGELIGRKIGAGNFNSLRNTLDADLRGRLDRSNVAGGDQWGDRYEAQRKIFEAAAGAVGSKLAEVEKQFQSIADAAARELAVNINVDKALAEVEKIRASIAAIPDVTYKSVVMTTQFSASPARPFSEFLPFMAKTFGSLQDMVANSTPEIILNVPDIAQRLRQIADLERASAEAFHSANFPRGVGQVDSSGVRRQNTDAGLSLLQQSQDLALLLQADIARAQLAAERRGGGAAASGGDTFIFDAKGATFNSMTLDDALLQFERTIINATGVDPRIRVTS